MPFFTDKTLFFTRLSDERVGFTDKIFIFVCLEVFNTQTYEYESSY
jgi:hypothetical protein